MSHIIKREYQQFYLNRGVPAGALYTSAPDNFDDYISTISYESRGQPKNISKARQLEYIKKIPTLDRPYLYVIGGGQNDTIAQQLALLLCAQLLETAATNTFYWHTLTGSYRDKIRDDETIAESTLSVNLLVISNIAKNSTTIKIEKLRDLIELYSGIPRIVIVAGCNPMDFAQNILYNKPNFVTYFGSREDEDE